MQHFNASVGKCYYHDFMMWSSRSSITQVKVGASYIISCVAVFPQSILQLAAPGLVDRAEEIEWDKWHVFFADERFKYAHPDYKHSLRNAIV